jgi:hypothetical protein
MFFSIQFLQDRDKQREAGAGDGAGPQYVISAPAPGNDSILAPWLSAPAPQHCIVYYRY